FQKPVVAPGIPCVGNGRCSHELFSELASSRGREWTVGLREEDQGAASTNSSLLRCRHGSKTCRPVQVGKAVTGAQIQNSIGPSEFASNWVCPRAQSLCDPYLWQTLRALPAT